MPRRIKPPKYSHHKASGQARVRIDGIDHYLGPHGSPESHREYAKLIDAWMARQEGPKLRLTVGQLSLRFLEHAKAIYRKGGRQTSELHLVREASKRLNQVASQVPTDELSPRHVKAMRERMIADGLSRSSCNHYTRRVRRMVKWGVSEELVPSSVLVALQALGDLKRGRSEARETSPVKPVPEAFITAIEPHVLPEVWGLICFQLATGCRPGEALIVRACDLDMTGAVWLYRPESHKLEHHGKERVIAIGPAGQAVLREFLTVDTQRPVFAVAGTDRAYRRDSYATAIRRGCKAASVPEWSPNRLRHNFATKARKEFGIEAARVTLGHSSTVTSEIYAERDIEAARAVVAKIG